MVAGNNAAEQPADREVVVTRVLDAPRSLVFKLWTRPEHLVRWWGPHGFTTTSCTIDPRAGGAYRICIRSPEGVDHWMHGRYREVREPDHLIFTFAWETADGASGHETLVTVAFQEHDGKTMVTFHQAVFQSTADRDSHHEGWSECLEGLVAYVSQIESGNATK
jgi:uncharacterized protein YndB with AHSA1/START domain